MTVPVQVTPQISASPTYLSEIFPLSISQPNLICFRLTPEVDRKIGNRFSWRFCQKFTNQEFPHQLVAIWEDKFFWVLGQPGKPMPSNEKWREALGEIEEELREDIGDRSYSIQWVRDPQRTASIIAQLAVRILQRSSEFSSADTVVSENHVEVKREANFWAETIELQDGQHPALVLTPSQLFLLSNNFR